MAVRWPDGSYTGSVKAAKPKPAPVEPELVIEPEKTTTEPEKASEKEKASNGDR